MNREDDFSLLRRLHRLGWQLTIVVWIAAAAAYSIDDYFHRSVESRTAPATVLQSPTANAGPDRTANVNETLSLDGTASTNAFDGWQTNSDLHSIRWDFGYGGWTFFGNLTAPVAYPLAGTYTVTLTVCNSGGTCANDSAQVTISAITEGTETTVTDSGNPDTNGSNLCTEISNRASANNPVITLTAGVVYRMNGAKCVLPNRTGTGYMTIRSSAHASLPDGMTRVFPADASDMAILEPGDHPSNPSLNSVEPLFEAPAQTNPAHHYRFIGLHVRKTLSTVDYNNPRAFFDIGVGSATSISQLPHHIQIDRCYIDGGSTTSRTTRGIALIATDSAVVNSYIYRIKGNALEVQAVWIGMGERLAVINNYLQGGAENMLSGGADPSISNHVPTDIVVRRNHMQKDKCWRSGDACYYGTDMTVKNIFEIKIGLRWSVQGNRFEDHWQEDQNWAITFTIRNQDGGATWSDIDYVDFAHNKLHKVGNGFQILTTDNLQTSQVMSHVIVRHTVITGMSFYNGTHNFANISDGTATGGGDKISFIRNSEDANGSGGQGRFMAFEDTDSLTNFFALGNAAQGFFSRNPGQNGTTALANATGGGGGSYTVTKNCFYLSEGTNPTDNTAVSTRADVKFTDISGFNLKLANDSPCLATGLGGGRAGADTDAVDLLTSGTVTGSWLATCNWHLATRCN